jgi:tRNA(His) 5'-end guanylyltransferase
METLGDRMKSYERAEYLRDSHGDYVLDHRVPFLARIDGHSFSKYTREFEKPDDHAMGQAMVWTVGDLVEEFNARTGYTQSDEITLVFMHVEVDGSFRELPFRGRVVKLASLMAGFASARFNFHINRILDENVSQGKVSWKRKVVDQVRGHRAHFDCRLFSVPTLEEVFNNLYWRSAHDCVRNSIHGLARVHFSSKKLHKKSCAMMKKMLLEVGIDWEKMSERYKYGTYCKKMQYTIDTQDQKSGEAVSAVRTKLVYFSENLTDYDEKFAELLGSKYYFH